MAVQEIGIGQEGSLYRKTDAGTEVFDFNAEYHGFYPACCFTAVAKCSNGFYVAGVDSDGEAHLFSAPGGTSWVETEMVPKDHPAARRECGRVLTILESPVDSHIYLICENGYVFTLPGCPKCVKEMRFPQKFTGGRIEEENLLISCENGEIITILLAALQQLRTSWSYALPALRAGAPLFDMREEDDCQRMLPYGQFVSVQTALLKIKAMDPSQPVFLFCYTGVQADTVTQYARFLGHTNAFSLGGPEHLLQKNDGKWPEMPDR